MIRLETGQENVADFVELHFLIECHALKAIWYVKKIGSLIESQVNGGLQVAVVRSDCFQKVFHFYKIANFIY